MTAAFYNTARHPKYGAAELKRLAGVHAMYGLFLSVGIVGAVFLIVFSLASLPDPIPMPRLPDTRITVICRWSAELQPQVTQPSGGTSETPKGGARTQAAAGATAAPSIGAVPVEGPDIPSADLGSDIPFGDGIDNPFGGNGNPFGNNVVVPAGGGNGNADAPHREQDDNFEFVPDVLPTVDEEGLRRIVEYPLIAKRLGKSGKVVVAVLVDVQGRAAAVSIASSTDEMFNQAALDAVARAAFKPAYRNGRPVQFRLYVPIEFKMK